MELMGKAITLMRLLLSIVSSIKYMVVLTLSHIGLLDPPEDAIYMGERTATEAANNNDYTLMADGTTLVPVPIPLISASTKTQLPIRHYGDHKQQHEQVHASTNCVVCWDDIEMSDQVRELCDCEHVFHRKCLDKWMDKGHVICPLCRSMLLPSHTNPHILLRAANRHHHDQQACID